MNIYLTSCETHDSAWRHQEELLRSLWELSSRCHRLVENPERAEVIIIGNLREEDWFKSLRNNPIISRYIGKCFAISEADTPRPLLRGVYTSAHAGLATKSRFRTAAYNLYHPDFRNPFVSNHQGGAFDRPKQYLYSFLGRNCHPVRSRIFSHRPKRKDVMIEDTSEFDLFTHDKSGKLTDQRKFSSILEQSKFVLCPRGNGAASIRLFEAMKMGVAPIIVADQWILPKGPNWSEFALFVAENEVDQLENIAVRSESSYRELGRKAAEAYAAFFADNVYFDYLVGQMIDIRDSQLVPEKAFWAVRDLVALKWRFERRMKWLA
jgi:hypothetical protein